MGTSNIFIYNDIAKIFLTNGADTREIDVPLHSGYYRIFKDKFKSKKELEEYLVRYYTKEISNFTHENKIEVKNKIKCFYNLNLNKIIEELY